MFALACADSSSEHSIALPEGSLVIYPKQDQSCHKTLTIALTPQIRQSCCAISKAVVVNICPRFLKIFVCNFKVVGKHPPSFLALTGGGTSGLQVRQRPG